MRWDGNLRGEDPEEPKTEVNPRASATGGPHHVQGRALSKISFTAAVLYEEGPEKLQLKVIPTRLTTSRRVDGDVCRRVLVDIGRLFFGRVGS